LIFKDYKIDQIIKTKRPIFNEGRPKTKNFEAKISFLRKKEPKAQQY